MSAKYQLWAEAVRNEPLAARIFQTALDLSDRREGALFVVVDEPDVAVPQLVAPLDRLDVPMPATSTSDVRSRRHLMHLLEGRSATAMDPAVLAALASLDGATVVDRTGRLRAAGAVLRHAPIDEVAQEGIVEGARTTAAIAASRFGPVLKVSEDGVVTFFSGRRVWDV
jgi:DNA integrity scanning protein DisA with diadenylate cyclase activity